jgi:endonuclease III
MARSPSPRATRPSAADAKTARDSRAKPGKTATSPAGKQDWTPARIARLLKRLDKLFPKADCALVHETPFQLLAATILSAQCTDARVNQATPELFALYPDAAALALATQEDVERIVRPLGFFRAKATNLRGMAQALVARHGGDVPTDLESLVALPGVGRKTANVVLGTSFGLATGVVVDTHVRRISKLLGLTTQNDPVKIERELMEWLPRTAWIRFSHQLILHGRATCIARRPRCGECGLVEVCDRTGLVAME